MGIDNYYSLTHPQKRIWYIEKMNMGSSMHNVGGLMKIFGRIDAGDLIKAVKALGKNNDAMRLRFTEIDGEPCQYVSEYVDENVECVDFSELENGREKFEAWYTETMESAFDLIDSKLCDLFVYKVSDEEYGVLLKIHHIIGDGWASNIIEKQISQAYEAFRGGAESFDMETYSYIDYIDREQQYLESKRFDKNKTFWNAKFEELPEKINVTKSPDLKGRRDKFSLSKEKTIALKTVLEEKKIPLSTFFITVKLLYISKIRAIDDVVIGVPVLNRSGVADKNTIGMYTSTMPLRVNIDRTMELSQLFKIVSKELKACLFNQRYPYDTLVNDLELRKKGYESLFDTAVNYYVTKYSNAVDGASIVIEQVYSGEQGYPLQLVIEESTANEDIYLYFDYKLCDYTKEEIELMYKYIMNITDAIIEDVDISVKDLSVIDDAEIAQKVEAFNDTMVEYPKDKTVIDLFEEQVARNPDKVAIMMGNDELTYLQLSKRVNRLANHLVNREVKAGDIVALMSTHTSELVEMIFAVLKIGAAYIPIDPGYPIERVNYMLNDSSAVMLYSNVDVEGVDFDGTVLFELDVDATEEMDTFENGSKADALSYIIYTSGSTGKPKGVMIEHGGLTNYALWASKNYLKEEDDIFAFYSSIAFDLTVTSIFAPLVSGRAMDIYQEDENEFVLYKILKEKRATVVKLTPSHLSLIKDMPNDRSSIGRFIVGGENLTTKLAGEITDSFGGDIEILNEYGPTETVVGCMIYRFDPVRDQGDSVPIGKPADNVGIYLMDRDMNMLPYGCEGEMYISGDGVARGYMNKHELTEASFVVLDEGPLQGTRMYKTGDLAKWLPDGNIEFIGRVDAQVKIRGHRIELGEIANALVKIENIADAVVKDREDPRGNKVLCAYIKGQKLYEDVEIKKALGAFIPKYMVPTYFMYVEEIPLTSSGKVDYNLLPEIEVMDTEYVASSNEMEAAFVKIAEEILGVEEISMNDNFFQLGGDSIKAIQIVAKMNDKGFSLKIKDIMQNDTIEEIASFIELSKQKVDIDQTLAAGEIKKTPITQWFFGEQFKNRNHYNQSVLLEILKDVRIEDLENVLEKLVEHHDVLRMNYNDAGNKLHYNNELLNTPFDVEYYDLSAYNGVELDEKIKETGDRVKGSFDIENGFMMKACLMKLSEESVVMLLTAHHLVVDGISWRVILDDFNTLLKQLGQGESMKLPMKTHSYQEWANAVEEYSKNGFGEEKSYWSQVVQSYEAYPAEFDLGADTLDTTETVSGELDEALTQELGKVINETYRMDFNEALVSGLGLALGEIEGLGKVFVEFERHGREMINETIDTSRTVGWFTTMFPVSLEVNEGDMKSKLKSLKEIQRDVPENGFNFGVMKYLKNSFDRNLGKMIRFNYLGDFDNVLDSELF